MGFDVKAQPNGLRLLFFGVAKEGAREGEGTVTRDMASGNGRQIDE